jgi:Polyketide cyclase / dehydrase and lipid transport
MASLLREAVIAAPPGRCWDALRAFGQVHELAKGFVTGTVLISDRERRVTWFNGAVGTELLIGTDEQAMRLAYTVTESPLGAVHYNAAAQVIPEGADHCRFVWAIDVLPDELADRVAAMMDAGLKAITVTLEAG